MTVSSAMSVAGTVNTKMKKVHLLRYPRQLRNKVSILLVLLACSKQPQSFQTLLLYKDAAIGHLHGLSEGHLLKWLLRAIIYLIYSSTAEKSK